MAEEKGGLWAVIPAPVRRDDHLPPNAKLLYGDLSALTYETGYCYASNEYLCGLYGWTERTVQRLLAALEDREFIRVEQIPGKERRIFCGVTVWAGPPTKLSPHPRQKSRGTPDKNVTPHNNVDKDIDKDIDNTPLTPQGSVAASGGTVQGGGSVRRRKREHRETPNWKPDRFARLWSFYPSKGKKDKQSAIRAWDELRPDDPLIAKIGHAIKKLKASEEWQRGVGIPYVATFLRGRRWEDAEAVDDIDSVKTEGGAAYEDRRLL